MRSPHALAFYLPQFHPIPENDRWWGKGFTEWRNVAKAQARFPGHVQPHLPADLGFYDLRLPEVQEEQAALARRYGIQGFIYYHYWFKGKRVLERPVQQLLERGAPDFPFCLCWANENWTRRWDGLENEVLLQQVYSPEDDERHFQSLLGAFKDPRYIRINGCPLFIIYRASHVPETKVTMERWRALATAAGLPGLFLVQVESCRTEHGLCQPCGFDAAIEFAPDWTQLEDVLPRGRLRNPRWDRWRRKLGFGNPAFANDRVYDYAALARRMLAKPAASYLRFPGVTPGWDNSARRASDALILHGSTPAIYKRWLTDAIERFTPPSPDLDFIVINAWNEWAEGNHLEPCSRFGHAYLEATRDALTHI